MHVARPDPLTAEDDARPACPRCWSCTISRQTGGHRRWWCVPCADSFRIPTYRVPEHVTPVERPHISAAGRAAIEWEPEE